MSAEFNTDGMLDIYLYETEQLLDNLQETALEYKDEEKFEDDQINEIFRAMHTIKGSSGVMMYDNIMHVAHKLEDIFYYIRENKDVEEPHMELVEHIFSVLDFINGELELIKEGESPDGDPEQLLTDLQQFLDKLKGEDSGGDGKNKKKQRRSRQEQKKNQIIFIWRRRRSLVRVSFIRLVFLIKSLLKCVMCERIPQFSRLRK